MTIYKIPMHEWYEAKVYIGETIYVDKIKIF